MKKIKAYRYKDLGQSLFEVIVALALIGIVLTGIVALSVASIRNASFAKNNAQANRYAQEAIEWIRRQRDANWDQFLNNFAPLDNQTFNYCLSDFLEISLTTGNCTFISGTIFTRELRVQRSGSTVDLTVTVSWTDSQGRRQVVNQTRLTNWRR
ncbi:MAG: type II secretion system GspH family protein [Patescibacteria group bacterium]|nr:type II secretion system GspH family protein [Patescibacteria group bacterium]